MRADPLSAHPAVTTRTTAERTTEMTCPACLVEVKNGQCCCTDAMDDKD